MKSSEIKIGETYLFVATENPLRKGLEGKPFTVYEIKRVWRRVNKKRANVKRYFNENGEAARAEELEPMTLTNKIIEKWKAEPVVGEPFGWGNFTGPTNPKEFEKKDDGLPF